MSKNANTGEIEVTPSDEIELQTVKDRAVKGVAFLTGRTFFLKIATFVSQALLLAIIRPEEWGVFALVSATINLLSYFADIGLGAALIQKREKPEEKDFKTVFAVQELLVITIVVFVFAISPILRQTHNLNNEALHLLYALNISFFLASLKNIPSIILERKLEFGKFVIPQVIENLVYNVSVVYFAWQGYGITSFTYAVLIRSVVGLVTIYILQPWVPGFAFSKESMKSLLKFGVPYQLNNFLAAIKDDGMIIVLGGILGNFWLGIWSMAQLIADYPLRLIMDNVTKVTFPAFSRMQDDKVELSKFLNRTTFFICALVFPALFGVVILFPVLITIIPKYGKWAPAFLPIIFLTSKNLWSAASTPMTNFLNSVGKIKITFKLMVMWTVLTWALVPLFSKLWGIVGAGMAYAIVGASSIVVFYIVKKQINWSLTYSVIKPLAASVFMAVVLLIVRNYFSENYNFINFLVMIICGGFAYALAIYVIVGKEIIYDAKKLLAKVIKK